MTSYSGEQSDTGIPNGYGVHSWPDGSTYEGYWRNGQFHGKGVYTWTDGDQYIGLWVAGVKSGQGSFICSNGDLYQGDFKEDDKNGVGVYYAANGDRYDGQWSGGQRHGKGIFYIAESQSFLDSDWSSGESSGKGVFRVGNGDEFSGQFSRGLRNGNGSYTFADGTKYESVWNDGVLDESQKKDAGKKPPEWEAPSIFLNREPKPLASYLQAPPKTVQLKDLASLNIQKIVPNYNNPRNRLGKAGSSKQEAPIGVMKGNEASFKKLTSNKANHVPNQSPGASPGGLTRPPPAIPPSRGPLPPGARGTPFTRGPPTLPRGTTASEDNGGNPPARVLPPSSPGQRGSPGMPSRGPPPVRPGLERSLSQNEDNKQSTWSQAPKKSSSERPSVSFRTSRSHNEMNQTREMLVSKYGSDSSVPEHSSPNTTQTTTTTAEPPRSYSSPSINNKSPSPVTQRAMPTPAPAPAPTQTPTQTPAPTAADPAPIDDDDPFGDIVLTKLQIDGSGKVTTRDSVVFKPNDLSLLKALSNTGNSPTTTTNTTNTTSSTTAPAPQQPSKYAIPQQSKPAPKKKLASRESAFFNSLEIDLSGFDDDDTGGGLGGITEGDEEEY
eukprot:TRINITY_DN4255_c0_g1_i1.p1 TRINITY_DN4255_c0_g1~~TRINITY_DN4255_c0_g1_i1.p1  ORF type:complete len:608 (+),score=152.52 TRINITY_DN4255_c0_g1_i1:719-2542(+)